MGSTRRWQPSGRKELTTADLPTPAEKGALMRFCRFWEEATIVAFRKHTLLPHMTIVNHPWTNGQVERMNRIEGRRQTLPL